MNRVLKLNSESHYNLTQISQFSSSLVRSVYYGKESISYLGRKIWDILPDNYKTIDPVGIYQLKVNNRNTRTRCEICSKLTIKTPERR